MVKLTGIENLLLNGKKMLCVYKDWFKIVFDYTGDYKNTKNIENSIKYALYEIRVCCNTSKNLDVLSEKVDAMHKIAQNINYNGGVFGANIMGNNLLGKITIYHFDFLLDMAFKESDSSYSSVDNMVGSVKVKIDSIKTNLDQNIDTEKKRAISVLLQMQPKWARRKIKTR